MTADNRLAGAMDRRSSKRFHIELEVSFKLLDRKAGAPETGSGRTVNFTSHGVLFRTQHSLRAGQRLELTISWPALLSGTCPLKLVALGRVLRAKEEFVAVTIEQYEFYTRRSKE